MKKSFEKPPAVSRREQNKADTRRRILAAASRLMAVSGTETRVEAIAAAAEVSRATFFNYFPNKGAVVAALVAKADHDFATTIDQERRRAASTAARLERLFVQTAVRLQSRPAFHKLILKEAERGYSAIRPGNQRFSRMLQVLRELLADGVARGEVRTDCSLDIIAEIVGGTYVALLHNWRISKDYPLEARMKASARFLADAIAPLQTRKIAAPRRAENGKGSRRARKKRSE
ncbi:MAG TPA: TetR/AcrR family transcriptional regulator [Steroidobacter sp.]|nr:TetR/AcrR family transcriptional regulator [Steroidobacter sp.]